MATITLQQKNNIDRSHSEHKPGIFNLFKSKCPRCRKGQMFQDSNPWHLKNTMKMNKECALCHQHFNLEVGFYYGAGYTAYALTVAFSVASFIAWWLILGFSLKDNRTTYWLITNAVLIIALQPYFMRIARTVWLALFVKYDKDWKINIPAPPERINKQQENNW